MKNGRVEWAAEVEEKVCVHLVDYKLWFGFMLAPSACLLVIVRSVNTPLLPPALNRTKRLKVKSGPWWISRLGATEKLQLWFNPPFFIISIIADLQGRKSASRSPNISCIVCLNWQYGAMCLIIVKEVINSSGNKDFPFKKSLLAAEIWACRWMFSLVF